MNGNYSPPVNMGNIINSEYDEWDPYVSPDESFIIFCSKKTGTYGQDDLYISFKKTNNEWSSPINMGTKINTKFSENRPYVSPDGRFLFFTRNITGNRNIYWVSASIIEKLKLKYKNKTK